MSLKITLVADNLNSWIIPYVKKLKELLEKDKYQVFITDDANKIRLGDLAFFLSCEKIVSKEVLSLSKHNLVIHESKLPKGKGWSPLTWQILEGKNKIPITLFEAVTAVDSGDIYNQDTMAFKGNELVDELRVMQGEKTIELALDFVRSYPDIKSVKQKGKSSYYPRRRSSDSELDINKTIKDQFNLLRIVDNERYPAFFQYKGQRYIVKIFKAEKKQ